MNLTKIINKGVFTVNEDLSSIFEKLNINKDSISPEMINNLMAMLENNSSKDTSNASSNSAPSDIDIETILKMKSIIDKMNVKKDDPRSRLLQALKPYLNENRQSKLDQYIQMSKIIELLPLLGGDFNANK